MARVFGLYRLIFYLHRSITFRYFRWTSFLIRLELQAEQDCRVVRLLRSDYGEP